MKSYAVLVATALLITGCGQPPVEVIDLNRVLDIMTDVLDEQSAADMDPSSTPVATERDLAKEKAFSETFAQRLNDANLLSQPIGVQIDESAQVIGFEDNNQDNSRQLGEKEIFKVQIDDQGGRLIATDTENNARPRSFGGSGFLLGYMLARHNGFYSGARSGLKPDFTRRSMSPQNYHTDAVNRARARSSAFRNSSTSSRSRGGSGGFSFGK